VLVVACAVFAHLAAPGVGAAQPAGSAAPGPEGDELNKQLNNPVSTIWSLNFQNNFQFFGGRAQT